MRLKINLFSMMILCLTVVGCIFIFINISSAAVTALEDDFSDGNMDGWIVVDQGIYNTPSDWNVVNEELVQSSNIYGGYEYEGTYAYHDSLIGLINYEVTLRLKSADNDFIGVMFRYQDQDNYYRFSMWQEGNYRGITKKVDGVVSTVVEDNFQFQQNIWYTLKIRVVGNVIQIWLNDEKLFGGDILDDSIPSGGIALYCWANFGAYFDDIVVTDFVDDFFILSHEPAVRRLDPINYIDVRFSEPVNPATFTADDIDMRWRGCRISVDPPQDQGANVWRISFPEQTAYGKYHVYVGPHVENMAGNTMNQDHDDYTPGEDPDDSYDADFSIFLNLCDTGWSNLDYGENWGYGGPHGIWIPVDECTSVEQRGNDAATFFVSDFNLIDAQFEGTMLNYYATDNDFIGFVFGFQGIGEGLGYYVVTWKRIDQSWDGFFAEEGFKLIKVVGVPTNGELMNDKLWDGENNEHLTILAQQLGDTQGWELLEKYRFTVTYGSDGSMQVTIRNDDTDEVLWDTGTIIDPSPLGPGKIGFYNQSQGAVRYDGFVLDQPECCDNLWNIRWHAGDYFHSNESWVRPWRFDYEDEWGKFVGSNSNEFPWDQGPETASSGQFPGLSWDYNCCGNLTVGGDRDHQFHARTYVYVDTPKIIIYPENDSCVAKLFHNTDFNNLDFDNPYPVSSQNAIVELNAGWNRIDVTGYNQNSGFNCIFDYDLGCNVDYMHANPLPKYNIDFLEDGNPGGWGTTGLKTFDDTFKVVPGSTFYVDIWLSNSWELPNPTSGGFWIDFNDSTALLSVTGVQRYNNQSGELPGPWSVGGLVVIGPAEDVQDGQVLVSTLNTSGATKDGEEGIIIARVEFECLAEGNVSVTVSPIPGDFDTWGPIPSWVDSDVLNNTFTVQQIIIDDCDLDGVLDDVDNCFCTENGPVRGRCISGNRNEPCHSNDECGINGVCSMAQEDTDTDLLGDVCDNCPNKQNTSVGGTCTAADIGASCMSDAECDIAGGDGFCSMEQEDTFPPQGNNIGDACDCEGNFDCDRDVDASDVTAFLNDFGRGIYNNPCTNANPCKGDFNCDVNVDANDVTKFLEDFGRSQFFNACPVCVTGQWCSYQ